jgi:hypothetical protein
VGAVLRFEMSGRRFAFDFERDITADELWALDELGVSAAEMAAVLARIDSGDVDEHRITRALCALAYLCARRDDPKVSWAEFSRTIAPATWRPLDDDEPVSVGEALSKPAEPDGPPAVRPAKQVRRKKTPAPA